MALQGRQASMLIVTIAVLVLGTGCQPLSSGAYAEEEERTLGEVADDFSITSALRARLLRDDAIRSRDISVQTRRGVVTLFGHVVTAQMEHRALELARGLPNVVAVESRLVVLEPEGLSWDGSAGGQRLDSPEIRPPVGLVSDPGFGA